MIQTRIALCVCSLLFLPVAGYLALGIAAGHNRAVSLAVLWGFLYLLPYLLPLALTFFRKPGLRAVGLGTAIGSGFVMDLCAASGLLISAVAFFLYIKSNSNNSWDPFTQFIAAISVVGFSVHTWLLVAATTAARNVQQRSTVVISAVLFPISLSMLTSTIWLVMRLATE